MTAKLIPAITKPGGSTGSCSLDIRPHILVVDDDQKIRELASNALTRSGFLVDAAEDGAIAWSAIQQENYDLLVTDNDMPNLTGVGLLQKLHEARMTLPVILTTGNVPQEELMRHPGLEIGAVLLKPYTFNELLDKVKNVLRTSYGDGELMASPI
jgi:two-component system phosphate regulon response regulator OmpR